MGTHTIILPETIDYDAYSMVANIILNNPDDPIEMFCRGDGGGSRDMLAILDLIHWHGNVDGILFGSAVSSHAIIWAACQNRYIGQFARLQIHGVTMTDLQYSNAISLQQHAAQCEDMNKLSAQILAGASNKDFNFWYQYMTLTAFGTESLNAQQLLEFQMGRKFEDKQYPSTNKNGHECYYKHPDQWFYADGTPFDNNRPCPKCGKLPTPEGYDACLGHIPGAIAACCGHGIEDGIIVWENNKKENDHE